MHTEAERDTFASNTSLKRVLYVATVDEHIHHFHVPYLKWLFEQGYEVHVAANGDEQYPYCSKKFQLAYKRTPFAFSNLKANSALKRLADQNHYDIIHFHTPVAGVFGRWAVRRSRNKGTKVLYTAHGFHFFKGAPLINRLLYYAAERVSARITDGLITINSEDYAAAQKFKMPQNGEVYKIPGIGVDVAGFAPGDKRQSVSLRKQHGIPEDAFVVLSVGELSKRKNHRELIKALAMLNKPDMHCVIVGRGGKREELIALSAELKLSDRVHLLGFKSRVKPYYDMADAFCLPSLQEGLSVALMEAMAQGLSCVASKIRGSVDLIREGRDGLLYKLGDVRELSQKLERLYADDQLRNALGESARERVGEFDLDHALASMAEIYRQYMK